MSEAYQDMATVDVAPTITDVSLEYNAELHRAGMVLVSDDRDHGDEVREIAQALHTQVYFEEGWIDEADLDATGLFIDEYSDRSTYILAENERRRSACRYIHADKRDGIMSLPTARYFSVDPDLLKEVAGVRRLSDIKPSEVIEVSGLASIRLDTDKGARRAEELDATRLMYATILRRSLDEGHKMWLLNIESSLLRHLNILIGKEQVHVLGEAVDYMGPATIPVAINPQEVVKAAFADKTRFGDMKRQYLLESLPGVSERHLSDDVKAALDEHNVPYEDMGRMRRIMKHRRALGYAAIVGYSSLRAFPASGVEEFHGDMWALWGIDVGTALPYAWGLDQTVSAKTPLRRTAGAAVAAGTFIAPYAYFWAEGNDYPGYVNAIAGGMIGTAALLEARKMRKDHALEHALRAR